MSHLGLGNAFGAADRLAEGAEEHRKAIALWSRLIASWPDTLDYQYHLASAYSNLGGTIGDPDEAIKVCREAVDRLVHLTKAHPGSRDLQHWLALSYINLGDRLHCATPRRRLRPTKGRWESLPTRRRIGPTSSCSSTKWLGPTADWVGSSE